MHADQLLPAVVAAVAVVCLLIAGRADGLEDYAPSAAVSLEMEPLAMSQNPGQFLPRPEVMPLPTDLLSRPEEAGGDGEEYVPQVEVVPEVVLQPGDPLAEALGGGGDAYYAGQPTTEPVTFMDGQGDFYRTGATPSPAEPPAKPSSPGQKKAGGKYK